MGYQRSILIECVSTEDNIYALLDLRGRKRLWNGPPGLINMYSQPLGPSSKSNTTHSTRAVW